MSQCLVWVRCCQQTLKDAVDKASGGSFSVGSVILTPCGLLGEAQLEEKNQNKTETNVGVVKQILLQIQNEKRNKFSGKTSLQDKYKDKPKQI